MFVFICFLWLITKTPYCHCTRHSEKLFSFILVQVLFEQACIAVCTESFLLSNFTSVFVF